MELNFDSSEIDIELFCTRAKKETQTLNLLEIEVSDGTTSLDFSDFGKLQSLEINTCDNLKFLSVLKINNQILKHIKFQNVFDVNVDSLEKVLEFECECFEFDNCRDSKITFSELVGIEGLDVGQEYTFQMEGHKVKLVKSQTPEDEDRFIYHLTYAQGKRIILIDMYW